MAPNRNYRGRRPGVSHATSAPLGFVENLDQDQKSEGACRYSRDRWHFFESRIYLEFINSTNGDGLDSEWLDAGRVIVSTNLAIDRG